MVVIKEATPSLRKLYGENFIPEVEKYSEVIGYSTEKDEDEFRVEFNPDRPDLFSFSQIKRAMEIFYGKKRWQPLNIGGGQSDFIIDKSVRNLRKYVIGFHCRGGRIGEHFRELIDYQEKLHLSIGRDRAKVSIGIHDGKDLRLPLTYSARNSSEVSFTTYDGTVTGTAKEILNKHPKGIEYAHLIPSGNLVPLIEDSDNRVLSMPPVVNGNATAVTEDTATFFIDITGTDIKPVKEAFFLLAYYFQNLEYEITGSNLNDIEDFLSSDGRKISVSLREVEQILGQKISTKECKFLLEKMGFGAEVKEEGLMVMVPGNRNDVMGPVDIIEDVAKGYGYGNLSLHMPTMDVIGAEASGNQIASNIRNIMTGLGYQEIMTFVVSKQDHYQNAKYSGGIQIRNPKSQDFSVVRDRLYLGSLDFLRLNKRRTLPQMIFEIGEIVSNGKQYTHICAAKIHSKSTFSDMKQVLDALTTRLTLEKYEIRPTDHENFVPGRTGKIFVDGKEIGILGEIHPETLDQYELKNPVVVIELDVTNASKLID